MTSNKFNKVSTLSIIDAILNIKMEQMTYSGHKNRCHHYCRLESDEDVNIIDAILKRRKYFANEVLNLIDNFESILFESVYLSIKMFSKPKQTIWNHAWEFFIPIIYLPDKDVFAKKRNINLEKS